MSKKVIKKETGTVVTVQPGTVVKTATKMDNLIEKRNYHKLIVEFTNKEIAAHKAWLKSESEKH